MKSSNTPTIIHLTGLCVLCVSVLLGYVFGLESIRENDTLREDLAARLADREAVLVTLPPREPEPEPTDRVIPERKTLTPTAFLATIEQLARESKLLVKKSRELAVAKDEDAEDQAPGSAPASVSLPRLEVVGEGRYTDVIAFFEQLDVQLTPLEIRSVRLTSLTDGTVEWGMICVNHTGRAGGD